MSLDLASLIERLRKIEDRLIKEESALLNLRSEVKDSISVAEKIWDGMSSDDMNNSSQRQSFLRKMSISGQAVLNNIRKKVDPSRTYPTPDIHRTASIGDEESIIPLSSSMNASRVPESLTHFLNNSKWDRMLRSDFFRKPAKRESSEIDESLSQLAINCIDDRISTTFVIHPDSHFKIIWDCFEFIIIIIQFFCLPIFLGFPEYSSGLPYLSIVTSIVFFIKMCISFRTGVIKNFTLIMDPRMISDIYFKNGEFLFDVISIFPYVFVVDALVPATVYNLLNQEIRFICLLNGIQLFKIAAGPEHFWYKAMLKKIRMKTKINAATIGIVKILVIMILYWHYSACIHNLVAEIYHDGYDSYSVSDRYTLYFYHAAAEMLAAGFGAIPPKTMIERWFTILNFLISAYLVATLVGNISSFTIGLDSSGRIFQEKIDEVSQYITYKGLDWNLRNRILEFYQYKYSGGKFFDEKRIMTELNNPLRKAIQLNNCKNLILKVPFFREADNSFISQLVLCLEINHFLTGDIVIEAGSAGDEMYFISSGICEVIIGGDVKATLCAGSFFGEISLLFGMMKRTASIKCLTACILYSLSKKQLDDVLQHHAQMAVAIRSVAEERLRNQTQMEASRSKREDSIISIDTEIKLRAFKISEEQTEVPDQKQLDVLLKVEEGGSTEFSEKMIDEEKDKLME